MFFPPELGDDFLSVVMPVWQSPHPAYARLRDTWAVLGGLQGVVLSRLLLQRLGPQVFAGPFRGMKLTPGALQGHFAPSLLGCYEWELHATMEKIIAHPYRQILNIGSAWGYYSIGLARRMSATTVHAFDINPDCQNRCREMAELNGVADRVVIGERFTGADYARFAGPETLVLMDIEAAETELLDPQAFPALAGMDVVVELHDCFTPGLSRTIPERFAATHEAAVIPNRPFLFPLDKILGPDYVMDHFDGLIATWEGRSGPTPWGVFFRKAA